MNEKKLLEWEKNSMTSLPVNYKFVKTTLRDANAKFQRERVIKSGNLGTRQVPVTPFYKPISRLI